MAKGGNTADGSAAEVRVRALEEAAAVARRLAEGWRAEGEGNHSGHHADLRRSWADAADKVADAIAALPGPGRTGS